MSTDISSASLVGKETITGIAYNPWSFRYIGVEEAKKVYDSGLTLEEYYKVND